ncbi:DUF6958 family protein [Flavitalea sp.]|nr:hypothetical protein [Flavitalea sp.]
MQLIKLQHTDPTKSTIEMDKSKYDLLKKLLIKILVKKQEINFEQLLAEVNQELSDTDTAIKGSIQWNLGWVSMDMEAKHELVKDETVEPPRYSLKG